MVNKWLGEYAVRRRNSHTGMSNVRETIQAKWCWENKKEMFTQPANRPGNVGMVAGMARSRQAAAPVLQCLLLPQRIMAQCIITWKACPCPERMAK